MTTAVHGACLTDLETVTGSLSRRRESRLDVDAPSNWPASRVSDEDAQADVSVRRRTLFCHTALDTAIQTK